VLRSNIVINADRDDELDALRIRQVAMLRRATYRARSYAIIAAVACGVAAIEAVFVAIRDVRAIGWSIWPVVYAIVAIAALYGGRFFLRGAIRLHDEVKRAVLPKPSAEPDFSTLNDGSQIAKNLEDVK
jgi:hypothetical protein